MLQSPKRKKKKRHITPLPPHNGDISTTAIFVCPQGGRFVEVRLCSLQNVPTNGLSKLLTAT